MNVVPPQEVVNLTRGRVLPGKSIISELSFSMVVWEIFADYTLSQTLVLESSLEDHSL